MKNFNTVSKSIVLSCSMFEDTIYMLFTKHPQSHNMTYLQHLYRALKFSIKMGYGSFCLFIHSLFPFLYKTKGTDIIKELYHEIDNRRPE